MTDSGVYLLLLKVHCASRIRVGALGKLNIYEGYYIYVGSGMNGLMARIARHLRKHKKIRWHIDYLLNIANSVCAFPCKGNHLNELDLVVEIGQLYEHCLDGFGASDSPMRTHLFFSETNPTTHKKFHAVLKKHQFENPILR